MATASHTIHITPDTADLEQALDRCASQAERLKEAFGDLPSVVAIERLTFKPGDTLIVRCDQEIAMRELEYIKRHVEETIPEVRCLVMSGGLTVEGVVAADE